MSGAALNPKDARVLVVEDSPADQQIVSRALDKFGIRHREVAKTAEEGLTNLRRRHYDVVLVDYNLPGMDGLAFIKNLREISPDTRAIVVTGVRQESVAVEAFKAGAVDYISKDDYLTSGIICSLQAALRAGISQSDEERRAGVSGREYELPRAKVEANWLLQALEERHGYRLPGSGPSDPVGSEWTGIIRMFVDYIQASNLAFPEPATEQEDAVLRSLLEGGVSPFDLLRLYLAALRELVGAGKNFDEAPIRPVLFLTHLLACHIEELQESVSCLSIERDYLVGLRNSPGLTTDRAA